MKNFIHKRKNDSKCIILKLEDNIYMEKMEYHIVPQYFLLNDNNNKDVYFVLKKTNLKINEKTLMNGIIEKKIQMKKQGISENFEGKHNLLSGHANSAKFNLHPLVSSTMCDYICEEKENEGKYTLLNCNKKEEIKSESSRKSVEKVINLLDEQKSMLGKRNYIYLTSSTKSIEKKKNGNICCRKENIMSLLKNSSKKFLYSAEKVKLFKKIFFNTKRKDDTLICDKMIVADCQNKCTNSDYTEPRGYVINRKWENTKEKKEGNNEREINETWKQFFLDKLSEKRQSICRRNNTLFPEEDTLKNNKMKDDEECVKSKSVIIIYEDGKKKILNKGINGNKKKHYHIKYEYKNKNTNPLIPNLSNKKKEYDQYGILHEEEKKIRTNKRLLLSNTKEGLFKPKEVRKMSKKKKNSFNMPNIEKKVQQKMHQSDNNGFLEYSSSGINIKQYNTSRYKRINMEDDKAVDKYSYKKEKQFCDVIKDKNGNHILFKKSVHMDNKNKIKIRSLDNSKNSKKTIVPHEEKNAMKGKKKFFIKTKENNMKETVEYMDSDESRTSIIMQYNAINESCKVRKEQNEEMNNLNGNPKKRIQIEQAWNLCGDKIKNCVYQETIANRKVHHDSNHDKCWINIENVAEFQKSEQILINKTNCRNHFYLICKDVNEKLGNKTKDMFYFFYEKNKNINRKNVACIEGKLTEETSINGINPNKTYFERTATKNNTTFNIYSNRNEEEEEEEKCRKKKKKNFEKNKLRIKNFVNKNEIFNLSRREDEQMKNEKENIQVSDVSDKLPSYSIGMSYDFICQLEKMNTCTSVNDSDYNNEINKSVIEKKIKMEEVLSAYPVEPDYSEGKNEAHNITKKNEITAAVDISTGTVILANHLTKGKIDKNIKNSINIATTNNSLHAHKEGSNCPEEEHLTNDRTDEDRIIYEQISKTDDSNNCVRIESEETKYDNILSYDKQKLLMEDLVTSISKENNYNNYYHKKKQKHEEGNKKKKERIIGKKNEDTKMEHKINMLEKKKKKFRSYFMKFRSFLFFQHRRMIKTVTSLSTENGSRTFIKKKKFNLRRKRKIKKLKSLRLLNMHGSKKMVENNSNVRVEKKHSEDCQSREYLLGQQREKEKGRKTIVLDLDETLVHSTLKGEKYNSFRIDIELGDEHCTIYVNKRPGVEYFFKEISKYYEVVIFTASLPKYANAVIDKLDEDNICAYRLFRESCTFWNNNYVKDLKILGRDLKNVVIIDNSTLVQKFCEENCILIKSWFDDPTDKELYKLVPFLKKLSKKV
ncbi:NLI interacting factor-like phosphatase [Plasmodium gonderi]|uniref:NLI interacting factor-like phosphatase n=1 Tax=Plasmodium gonderi TaxID=77519 RepID=A0A1Y1JL54_PLAGO|nr:NLI interacting factor-like phosphatase [Plasmodium gonderi]GAW83256.1 NLI interacting factor-like phosphatase [Plasmodium gonderi]